MGPYKSIEVSTIQYFNIELGPYKSVQNIDVSTIQGVLSEGLHCYKTLLSPVYTGILIRIEINPDSNLPIERELANPNSNPGWTRSHEINPDYEPDIPV